MLHPGPEMSGSQRRCHRQPGDPGPLHLPPSQKKCLPVAVTPLLSSPFGTVGINNSQYLSWKFGVASPASPSLCPKSCLSGSLSLNLLNCCNCPCCPRSHPRNILECSPDLSLPLGKQKEELKFLTGTPSCILNIQAAVFSCLVGHRLHLVCLIWSCTFFFKVAWFPQLLTCPSVVVLLTWVIPACLGEGDLTSLAPLASLRLSTFYSQLLPRSAV